MENDNAYQERINEELKRFIELLKTALPRYNDLVKKCNISKNELDELGELEYFLIELNGKIAQLKKQLEHDLFGLTLDSYYKLKKKALKGDVSAIVKITMMRKAFDRALKGNNLINWN